MGKERNSFKLGKKQQTEKTDKWTKDQKKRNDQFDENRPIKKDDNIKENSEKKPFDKKTYRLKKYSKKYKLDQWEELRKKNIIQEFKKKIKNDPVLGSYKPKAFDEDTIDSHSIGKYVRHPDIIEKEVVNKQIKEKDPFKKAKDHFNKVKEEKAKKREELEKINAERSKKLQEYKKNKHERFKKLSKKTKKGQPMMTGRLELLLDKIQKGF